MIKNREWQEVFWVEKRENNRRIEYGTEICFYCNAYI